MTKYFADDFKTYDRDDWMTSTWSSQGSTWLHTSWRDDNVDHNAKTGQVTLTLNDDNDRGKAYTGAEIQSKDFYEFGIFEIKMQASGEDGVNSNFFTYSGEVHGNVKNEIDFEFLGKDPTKVWTSYHSPVANGYGNNGPVGKRGEWVDLGFDSSKGMHTYRIEWLPDSIRWYADGKLLREVVPPKGMSGADIGIPEHAGKMYMNIWAGSPEWLGRTDKGFEETTAVYDSVKYIPWDHPEAASYGNGVNLSAANNGPELAQKQDVEKAPAVEEAPAPVPQKAAVVDNSTKEQSGGGSNDQLKGTSGSDKMYGGAGNDKIAGRGGDDELSGGSGNDHIVAGEGDDELIYVAADNIGARDIYAGSKGRDTLTLELTEEMAARADVVADLAAFQKFMNANSNEKASGGSTFVFESLGLTVKAIEVLDVVVTGNNTAASKLASALAVAADSKAVLTDLPAKAVANGPAEAPAPITADKGPMPSFASVGSDGAEFLRGRSNAESFNGGGGNDKILSRDGNDVVAGGSGNDYVKAGAGNDELIYIAADNVNAKDRYQGSSGHDTLSIFMTQDEVDASDIANDIAAFRSFAADNHNLNRNGGESFKFNSFDLEVQSVEEIELVVYDGY